MPVPLESVVTPRFPSPHSPSRRSAACRGRRAVGQLLVIEAEQVQDRRVPVVDVDLALDGLEAVVVGAAVGEAALRRRRRPSRWCSPCRCGRGRRSWRVGVRPNSPPQITSVSFSMPRCFRSCKQAGDRLVDRCCNCWSSDSLRLRWWSQPPSVTSTKRTPASTKRRASRHCRPKPLAPPPRGPPMPGKPPPPPPPRSSMPYSLERRGRFAARVHQLRQLGLHAEGEFVGLDQPLDLRVRAAGFEARSG